MDMQTADTTQSEVALVPLARTSGASRVRDTTTSLLLRVTPNRRRLALLTLLSFLVMC
ncbi:MAG: hypothetical protein AAGD00_08925 [Planctomycetota bacterium]